MLKKNIFLDQVYNIKLYNWSDTRLFAQIISSFLKEGDVVTLRGNIGAGKTTLARHLIRAIDEDDELEVSSPTYAIMHSYNTSRFEICHYDFYRLTSTNELYELNFLDNLENVVSIIEWPEIASEILPDGCIEIYISEIWHGEVDYRRIRLTVCIITAERMDKALEMWSSLKRSSLTLD
ncbi:MAG TPA: hypothetical protein TECP_00806 [Hyphomicrobiaceae bacterium MAG_BT-2024]